MKKLFVILMAISLVMTSGIVAFADDTEVAVQTTKPAQVQKFKVSKNGYSSLKLTWTKVDTAQSYQIYRATIKRGKYTLKATTNETTYKNSGLTSGKTYYYKVRAINEAGKGSFSTIKSNKVQPATAKLTGVTYYNKGSNKYESQVKLKVAWTKVSGASGYEVYRRITKKSSTNGAYDIKVNGSYKKIATVTSSKLYFIDGMRDFAKSYAGAASRQYEYKVRAYKTVNGKKVYGDYSKPGHYTKDWTVEKLKEKLTKYGESIVLYEYDSLKEPICNEYGEMTYMEKTDRTYTVQRQTASTINPENSTWSVLWPENISNIYHTGKYMYDDLKDAVACDIEDYGNANPQGYDRYGEYSGSRFNFMVYVGEENDGSKFLYCLIC